MTEDDSPDEDTDDEQDTHSARRLFYVYIQSFSLQYESPMLIKMCPLAEGFITLLTLISFLPSMNSGVE